MHYNDEQFNALAAIENELRRAIDRNYARIPHRETLDAVRAAYMQATGLRSYPQNWGCTSCCINLLKDAGRLYFEDKAEREMAAAVPAHEALLAAAQAGRTPLDFFVRKYEITYEDAKAAAERIGVEVVDGEVPDINYEDICQEIREHVLGLPGGFNADGLTLDEIHKAKAAAKTDNSSEGSAAAEEAAEQETAPTEAGTPANSDAKAEAEETPAEPEKAPESAPKSKTTKTTKK